MKVYRSRIRGLWESSWRRRRIGRDGVGVVSRPARDNQEIVISDDSNQCIWEDEEGERILGSWNSISGKSLRRRWKRRMSGGGIGDEGDA